MRKATITALTFALGTMSLCATAWAEMSIAEEALVTFQSVCLTDTEQYLRASEYGEGLEPANKEFQTELLDGQVGQVWLLNGRPAVGLIAYKVGGCGLYMGEIDLDILGSFERAIPSTKIFKRDYVGSAKATWRIVSDERLSGVVFSAAFTADGRTSADLRYVPAIAIVANQSSEVALMLSRTEYVQLQDVLADLLSRKSLEQELQDENSGATADEPSSLYRKVTDEQRFINPEFAYKGPATTSERLNESHVFILLLALFAAYGVGAKRTAALVTFAILIGIVVVTFPQVSNAVRENQRLLGEVNPSGPQLGIYVAANFIRTALICSVAYVAGVVFRRVWRKLRG
jgi:hypothetical protein